MQYEDYLTRSKFAKISSVERISPWDANSRSDGQEISRLLWKSKVLIVYTKVNFIVAHARIA